MHCTDDDLVLHHYGDPEASPDVAAHVAVCASCRERAADLEATLRTAVFPEVPDPGPQYEARLWQQLEPRLEVRRSVFTISRTQALSLAAAAALLLTIGFMAGRSVPDPAPRATRASIDAGEARRVLLLSVADHLDRSDRVLTDIMNASADGDIAAEQRWAADLISDNRFYRQDAVDSDESSVAAVLDELERALLDIVHSPSEVMPPDLEAIHRRLDSAALLFKVRVLGSDLRRRQQPPPPPSPRTSPRTS